MPCQLILQPRHPGGGLTGGCQAEAPAAGSQSHGRGWRPQDPHSPCRHLQRQRCSPLGAFYVAFNLALSDSSQAVNVRADGVLGRRRTWGWSPVAGDVITLPQGLPAGACGCRMSGGNPLCRGLCSLS